MGRGGKRRRSGRGPARPARGRRAAQGEAARGSRRHRRCARAGGRGARHRDHRGAGPQCGLPCQERSAGRFRAVPRYVFGTRVKFLPRRSRSRKTVNAIQSYTCEIRYNWHRGCPMGPQPNAPPAIFMGCDGTSLSFRQWHPVREGGPQSRGSPEAETVQLPKKGPAGTLPVTLVSKETLP